MKRSIIIIICLFLLSASLWGQEVEYVGSCDTPGQAVRVYVQDNYAYVAALEGGLLIIDISDPENPLIVGNFVHSEYDIRSAFIGGSYAYLGGLNIHIIDISDPTDPTLLGEYLAPGYGSGVQVVGDLAYVASSSHWDGFFHIFDITYPFHPLIVESIYWLDAARDVHITGEFAYVADDDQGLIIIDISDSENPAIIGNAVYPNSNTVFVQGDYAYIGAGGPGSAYGPVVIYDVSDPSQPTLIGSLVRRNHVQDLFVQGQYAYAAKGLLEIVDVSEPTDPTLVLSYDTPYSAVGIYVSGNYIYVADLEQMLILRFEGQPSGSIEGIVTDINYEPIENVYVNVGGTSIYDSTDNDGYYLLEGVYQGICRVHFSHPYLIDSVVVDVQVIHEETTELNVAMVNCGVVEGEIRENNTSEPIEWIHVEVINYNMHTFSDGDGGFIIENFPPGVYDLLFSHHDFHDTVFTGLTVRAGENTILDVRMRYSDEIEYIGSCRTPGNAYDIVVDGGFAYVADGLSGLQVVDIANPGNPTIVGRYDTPDNAMRIDFEGDYAYIADRYTGLQIIDVADPENPNLAGSYYTPEPMGAIFVERNYAYALTGLFYLEFALFYIFDVYDPQNPILISSYELQTGLSSIRDVYVADDYAYVICGSTFIIDVADPSSPTLVSIYGGSWGTAERVFVSGNYAYLTETFDHHLDIVDITDRLNPISVGIFDDFQVNPLGVFVEAGFAYVANYTGGLKVIDVLSNPQWPTLQGGYDTPDIAWNVFVSGYHIFVADEDSLLILGLENTGTISGVVSDGTSPIEGVYVRTINNSMSDSTDINGQYLLDDLPRGIYEVAFSHPDYIDTTVSGILVTLGNTTYLNVILRIVTGIEETSVHPPAEFSVAQNFPNPFNSATTIKYDLPTDSDVMLEIYDILGRKVETLINGWQSAGAHSIVWDAEDVSSGVYFYRIQAGEYVESRSCLLLK
jgi:hypothetical protein